jgi:hypothetical protein
MTTRAIVDEKDSAKYLLNFIRDVTKKGYGSETIEAVKAGAANALIEEHSESALSSVLKEFEEEFAKENHSKAGPLTGRRSELSAYIGSIKETLKTKADTD